MCILFCLCFYYIYGNMLSHSCIPLIQLDSTNKLNCFRCWFRHPLPVYCQEIYNSILYPPKFLKFQLQNQKKKIQICSVGIRIQEPLMIPLVGNLICLPYIQASSSCNFVISSFPMWFNAIVCKNLQKPDKILNCLNLTGFESDSSQLQLPIKNVSESLWYHCFLKMETTAYTEDM